MIGAAVGVLGRRRARRLLPLAALAGFVCALALLALLASVATVLQQQQDCGQTGGGSGLSPVAAQQIPPGLTPIYRQAASTYGLGTDGWAWLAAINRVETDFGRDLSTSTAGAVGWMQFEPATWAVYGVDADRNGVKDPYDPTDAIFAAANYLHASGAPADWQRAVLTYNHSTAYLDQVAGLEQAYAQTTGPTLTLAADATPGAAPVGLALRGRASTYGDDPLTGYVDALDNNRPALAGATNDVGGIAVLDAETLGGWWEVRAPNGVVLVLQQTDYGPSASTGRVVDVNALAARLFGYAEGSAFPTDRGRWTLRYAGLQRPANAATPAQGAPSPTASAPAVECMPCPGPGPGAAGTTNVVAQVDPGAVPDEHGGYGFTPAPGTDYAVGEEPAIADRLDAVGRALGLRLTGISGYRTTWHSVAVGGYADDPHTQAAASDTAGVEEVPEATLEQFGLTRPFDQITRGGRHTNPREANHIQLLATTPTGAATLTAAAAIAADCESGGTVPLNPGDRARILPSGLAAAPADAPPAVKAMIAAGNQLIGLPYRYGGGHTTFNLAADQAGVDCSGAVSWILHAAGLLPAPADSSALEAFQAPGSGLWVTVYAETGHTFIDIAGIRMDTSPQPGDGPDNQQGPRWRPATRSTTGFIARHPTGL